MCEINVILTGDKCNVNHLQLPFPISKSRNIIWDKYNNF